MARRRYELTDGEWVIIEPLLPNKPRGTPRVDDRRVLNGILGVSAPARHGRRYPSAMDVHGLLTSVRPLAQSRGVGPAARRSLRRFRG